jgi:hypothetical protein
MTQDQDNQDDDRFGKMISTGLLVLLAAFFAYAYVPHFLGIG